jgi:hypothetical protein
LEKWACFNIWIISTKRKSKKKKCKKKMLISIEELRKREKKRVIRKVYYLKRKFRGIKCYFITITFRKFEDYMIFDKEERKKLMENLKKNYGLRAAFSVVEAQQRGVPHVHMLVWMPKRIFIDNQFKKVYRSLGMTNIIRVKNKYIIYYLLKYMLKEEERDIIKYKYKQHFYSFYYKNKRKDKEWVLLGLSGINKIIRKYELKVYKIKDKKYIFFPKTIISYRVEAKFIREGLYIRDWKVWVDNEEYSRLDFRDYIEFLNWFEIAVKLNLN